jgi:hypothetical protein
VEPTGGKREKGEDDGGSEYYRRTFIFEQKCNMKPTNNASKERRGGRVVKKE